MGKPRVAARGGGVSVRPLYRLPPLLVPTYGRARVYSIAARTSSRGTVANVVA